MSNRPFVIRAFALAIFLTFIFIAIPAVLFANSASQPERQVGQTVPGTVPTRTPVINRLPVIFKEPIPTATPTVTPINTPGTSCTPFTAVEADEPAFELLLQADINQKRAENGGLAGYTLNPQLVQAARRHARNMGSLSDSQLSNNPHVGTDGSTINSRIAEACYTGSLESEIVGWGFSSLEQMMNWWMNSSVHRGIILSTSKNEYGPTLFTLDQTQYTNYWTVTFGNSAGRRSGNLYQCHYVSAVEDRGISAVVWQDSPCE